MARLRNFWKILATHVLRKVEQTLGNFLGHFKKWTFKFDLLGPQFYSNIRSHCLKKRAEEPNLAVSRGARQIMRGEGSYNGQTNLVMSLVHCLYCLVFHKHNSLPLGQIQAIHHLLLLNSSMGKLYQNIRGWLTSTTTEISSVCISH